jgi:hypothetical protein
VSRIDDAEGALLLERWAARQARYLDTQAAISASEAVRLWAVREGLRYPC